MNFDDLTRIWQSPHNQSCPAQLESDKMKFITGLHRRRRAFVLFMATVLTALVIPTGKLLLDLLWPGPAMHTIDFKREWGILPLLALPWAVWITLLVQYRRHRHRHPSYEGSIKTSLQALLDENRLRRALLRIIACLQVAFALILPLMIQQLKTAGKAGNEINAMLVGVPVLFGGIMLGMGWLYWRVLLPKKRALEALLNS